MSNDMPDVIYIGKHELTLQTPFYSTHFVPFVYSNKYYSESHVQQLIKEAEERQREKCVESLSNAIHKRSNGTKLIEYWQKAAILNAGGE